MSKPRKNGVDRRKFLKTAAVGGVATLVAGAGAIRAQESTVAAQAARTPVLPPREGDPPAVVELATVDRSGSDFMVDVIKTLGFEYVAANPGSSYRGIHESLINYGGNKNPEFITCCHEESSVHLAQGYAQVEGKPMLVLAHSTVGLQHASMGVYDAWAGRTPVVIMIGNTIDANERRPGVEWFHSAQDAASMVRDFTKWDDLPISLPHFAESAVRAYKISMTPPREPVVIVLDSTLMENPIPKDAVLHIPKLTLDGPPTGDPDSVIQAAKLLVAAENPVLIAGDFLNSDTGLQHFIELVDTLQIPVIDQGRSLPSRHPLNQSRGRTLIPDADVIIGLGVADFWGTVNANRDAIPRTARSLTKAGAKIINISSLELEIKSNYQDFQRFQEFDLSMAADPEATLPLLTEAVKRLLTDDRKRTFTDRRTKFETSRQRALARAREEATNGWNSSPISIARLSAEVWNVIKNEDWCGGLYFDDTEWNYTKFYQRPRGASGQGAGDKAPLAIGAALAHRKHGRLYVNLQKDGDLMYAPGVLWTAAHHRIPLLNVMYNNRGYHQEVMHIQRMANRHQRGIENAGIGTTLVDPNIDFAKVAQGLGWYAEGPITNPNDLGPALKRAVAVVKRGEPALLDTVTQPR
jgi:thiamine pyrophosphate-dependent acetolactate synthase large subunit-like protein